MEQARRKRKLETDVRRAIRRAIGSLGDEVLIEVGVLVTAPSGPVGEVAIGRIGMELLDENFRVTDVAAPDGGPSLLLVTV